MNVNNKINTSLTCIEENFKYKLFDNNHNSISNEWIAYILSFKRNDDIMFECDLGKIYTPIPNDFFDWENDFSNGFAILVKNNKYNIINDRGKFMSDIWFDKVQCYIPAPDNSDGSFDIQYINDIPNLYGKCYMVMLNKKFNIINLSTQKYLSHIWYDECEYIEKNNSIKIFINNNYYSLDMNGNIAYLIDN